MYVAEGTAQAIKNAIARIVEGALSLTAIIFMLLLGAVLAYAIVGSCSGQFERHDDFFRELPIASPEASSRI